MLYLKAMGNGYTIAALAGRADLMDRLGTEVTIDGSYYASPYGLAAGIATFDLLADGGILLPPYVITDARINLAFTEDDADETFAAAGSALRRVR